MKKETKNSKKTKKGSQSTGVKKTSKKRGGGCWSGDSKCGI